MELIQTIDGVEYINSAGILLMALYARHETTNEDDGNERAASTIRGFIEAAATNGYQHATEAAKVLARRDIDDFTIQTVAELNHFITPQCLAPLLERLGFDVSSKDLVEVGHD